MEVATIWTIKTFPMEGFHPDFVRFIESKWEYFDTIGEHIYLPLTLWAKTNHITPPGEAVREYEIVLKALDDSGCDMFTLLKHKWMLQVGYYQSEEIRVMQFEKELFPKELFEVIRSKYEYKGVDGDHLYSPTSVWFSFHEAFPSHIKQKFIELMRMVRASSCDLFDFT